MKTAAKNETLRIILAWCDRSGEEPEGQCLHEIENVCREALGLDLLKPALTNKEIGCCSCGRKLDAGDSCCDSCNQLAALSAQCSVFRTVLQWQTVKDALGETDHATILANLDKVLLEDPPT